MVRRYKLMLLSLIAGLVVLSVWISGQSSNGSSIAGQSQNLGEYFGGLGRRTRENVANSWNYSPLFRLLKLDAECVDRYNLKLEDVDDNAERVTGNGKVEDEEAKYVTTKHSIGSDNKTVVLMWTKYYTVKDETHMNLIMSGRRWDPSCCTADDLIVTFNRSMLPKASVIVFFNYFGNLELKDLPPTRTPSQLWVVFGKESPAHSHALGQFPDMFNWTMSYRHDSDIWSPYGFTSPLENPISPTEPIMMPSNVSLSQWIAAKTETLAGVISHCPTASQRERLAKALRNASLPVDIFGGCGNRSLCPRNRKDCDHDKFWKELGINYKFYFAAENSLCVDYITEKFWRTLERGMVPLVYGGANYTAVAPPHSFIDVRDFKSPKDIVDFLKLLADDPVEYAKYFEWKRKYRVTLADGWGGWCTLCKLARQYHNNPEKVDISPNKSYKDLRLWWTKESIGSKKGACTKPPFVLEK